MQNSATDCARKILRKSLDRRFKKRFEVVPICFTAIQGQKLTLPDRKNAGDSEKCSLCNAKRRQGKEARLEGQWIVRMSGPELLPLSGWEGEKAKRNIEMLSLPRKFRNISHKVFVSPGTLWARVGKNGIMSDERRRRRLKGETQNLESWHNWTFPASRFNSCQWA